METVDKFTHKGYNFHRGKLHDSCKNANRFYLYFMDGGKLMKKIVSFLIVAAMMIGTALSVCAAEPNETDKAAVYTLWTTRYWESAVKMAESLAKKNPDMAEELLADVKNYEDFCQANCPTFDAFDVFDSYGAYGDDSPSFWRIASNSTKGFGLAYAGDYVFNLTGVIGDCGCGVFAYTDGQLLDIDEAYKIGAITDADLSELFASNAAGEIMQRLGDMNGDKTVDVVDLLLLKNYIMGQSISDNIQYFAADVTADSKYDVSDIVALKDHIMAQ